MGSWKPPVKDNSFKGQIGFSGTLPHPSPSPAHFLLDSSNTFKCKNDLSFLHSFRYSSQGRLRECLPWERSPSSTRGTSPQMPQTGAAVPKLTFWSRRKKKKIHTFQMTRVQWKHTQSSGWRWRYYAGGKGLAGLTWGEQPQTSPPGTAWERQCSREEKRGSTGQLGGQGVQRPRSKHQHSLQ